MNLFVFLIFVGVALSGSVVPVVNGSCKLFVFGDSNSDTGGSHSMTGVLDEGPNGRIFPNKPSRRASDGRLILDFLSEYVTATYVDAYLNSVGTTFASGVNFAVAGSRTTGTSISLEVQTKQFQSLWNVSATLQARGVKGLIGQEDFNTGLYLIDIGQNDLVRNNSNITGFVSTIEDTIKAIYHLGGRNYWVHNTGPYGCLPSTLESNVGKVNSSDYDESGCISSFNEAAQQFNSQVHLLCQKLKSEFKDVTIVYVDIYTIKYDLIANPSAYGFTNPLKKCWDKWNNNSVCPDGSKSISWDGVHYTEAANRIVASKILSTSFSKPPLPLNFFCSS